MDGFASWIIKPVHRLDTSQHAEPIKADDSEKETKEKPHQQSNWHEGVTCPFRAKAWWIIFLGEPEDLQLHVGESQAHFKVIADRCWPRGEQSWIVAAKGRSQGSGDFVAILAFNLQAVQVNLFRIDGKTDDLQFVHDELVFGLGKVHVDLNGTDLEIVTKVLALPIQINLEGVLINHSTFD